MIALPPQYVHKPIYKPLSMRWSDSIDDAMICGAAAGLGSAFTFAMWLFQYDYALGQTFLFQPLTAGGKSCSPNGTAGNIEGRVRRVTSASVYITSTTPLAIKQKWYFVVMTYDDAGGASNLIHLYVGDEFNPVVDQTTTKTDGVGALNAESGGFIVGNQLAGVTSFNGCISFTAAWPRLLNIQEMREVQFNPRPFGGTCVKFFPGEDGPNIMLDWSGNHNHAIRLTTGDAVGPFPMHFAPIPLRYR